MDSRVRGNDGGEAGIRRRKSDGGGGDSDLHRNANAAEFCEKNAVIPAKAGTAKAGIYSGRLILEFREFYGKIKFGIFARFFCKKRGECRDLSAKMDSRVRGNDGGEAEIPAAFSFFSKLKTINRVHLEFSVFGELPEIFPSETGGGADCPAVVTQNAFQI